MKNPDMVVEMATRSQDDNAEGMAHRIDTGMKIAIPYPEKGVGGSGGVAVMLRICTWGESDVVCVWDVGDVVYMCVGVALYI